MNKKTIFQSIKHAFVLASLEHYGIINKQQGNIILKQINEGKK